MNGHEQSYHPIYEQKFNFYYLSMFDQIDFLGEYTIFVSLTISTIQTITINARWSSQTAVVENPMLGEYGLSYQ